MRGYLQTSVSTAQAELPPLGSEAEHSKARWVSMRVAPSPCEDQAEWSGAESGPGLVQDVLPGGTGEKAGDCSIDPTMGQV